MNQVRVLHVDPDVELDSESVDYDTYDRQKGRINLISVFFEVQ